MYHPPPHPPHTCACTCSCTEHLQGEEPLHDAIRACVITAGAPRALVSVLTDLADDNEEVLWAALFLLAVLLREASPLYVEHVLALASAGMLRALREALAAYRGKVAREVRLARGWWWLGWVVRVGEQSGRDGAHRAAQSATRAAQFAMSLYSCALLDVLPPCIMVACPGGTERSEAGGPVE